MLIIYILTDLKQYYTRVTKTNVNLMCLVAWSKRKEVDKGGTIVDSICLWFLEILYWHLKGTFILVKDAISFSIINFQNIQEISRHILWKMLLVREFVLNLKEKYNTTLVFLLSNYPHVVNLFYHWPFEYYVWWCQYMSSVVYIFHKGITTLCLKSTDEFVIF